MKKYTLKRVISEGVGWEYNPARRTWEMWHKGKTHWCISVNTSTVARDFIEYNFKRRNKHETMA